LKRMIWIVLAVGAVRLGQDACRRWIVT